MPFTAAGWKCFVCFLEVLHFLLAPVHVKAYNKNVMDEFALICEEVLKSLRNYQITGNILVALSGGSDSVALLLALHSVSAKEDIRVSAVYINHGLRSAASSEEDFCRDLCARLHVPFHARKIKVGQEGSLENAARTARYAALYRLLEEQGGGVIALAHHMDDQAETVLLHLFYGSGSDGLGGMMEFRPPLWRPLLHVRKSSVRTALLQISQNWMEDESNRDLRFTRNYLRNRVMPVVEVGFPKAVIAVDRAAKIIRDENDFLKMQADGWLAQYSGSGKWKFLMAAPFLAIHPALQRRILREYAYRSGVQLDFETTEVLRGLQFSSAGTVCNLPGGWQGMKTDLRIHLIPPAGKEQTTVWNRDSLQVLRNCSVIGNGKKEQSISKVILAGSVLRTRMANDWICPFGMKGHVKLKDYMISRGMDRPFRSDWPLLCRGSEVLWVVGVGGSEMLRVSSPCQPDIVTVRFEGRLPDEI